VLTDINPMLHERTDKQTFITCLLARYDFTSRVFRFANAGHCRPLLKRAGSVQYLNAPLPRFPLGFRSDVTYAETEFQLQPGDVVMLSPACASFDQFRDFEARGDSFRQIVEALIAERTA
jgi:serine phosphatase RsbU (regulator of sigma subunit)